MKFRDPKTGEVFEALRGAHSSFCSSRECKDCELNNYKSILSCYAYHRENIEEMIDLMGYEVVEDSNCLEIEAVEAPFVCQRLGVKPWQPFIVHGYPHRNYPPLAYMDGHIGIYAPDKQQRHRIGSNALMWILEHPERIEPCVGYTPREMAFKKEEAMEKTGKPRICELLGVDVGERFNIVGYSDFDSCDYDTNQRFFIDSTGTLLEEMKPGCDSPASVADGRVVCLVWNHPDRILRKPRFTEEEVEDARVAKRFCPDAVAVHRTQAGNVLLADARDVFAGKLPNKLFPSLRPGQSVALKDVMGGENG